MSEWSLFHQPTPRLDDEIPQAGYARRSGAPYSEPGTSKEAAESFSPERMKTYQAQVLAVLTAHGARGAAAFEIAAALGVQQHWLTSTIAALGPNGTGQIMKSPRHVINPDSGKRCILLVRTRCR